MGGSFSDISSPGSLSCVGYLSKWAGDDIRKVREVRGKNMRPQTRFFWEGEGELKPLSKWVGASVNVNHY